MGRRIDTYLRDLLDDDRFLFYEEVSRFAEVHGLDVAVDAPDQPGQHSPRAELHETVRAHFARRPDGLGELDRRRQLAGEDGADPLALLHGDRGRRQERQGCPWPIISLSPTTVPRQHK